QRGAANRLTPKKVLEAKDLITAGKVFQLGRPYEAEMPVKGKRHFSLTIPGLPTGKPSGKNQLVHNDELVSGEIGQVGTQFDGLGWLKDNKKFDEGEPGIGMAAAKWLTEKKVCLIGSDNWAVEVVPSEDPDRPFAVHQWLLTRHGIYLLENLDLSELAKEKVSEFAFSFAPLKLKGATGSPGNPLAIR